jgi:hypothetical protein
MNRTIRRMAAALTTAAALSVACTATASAAPPSGTPQHPFTFVLPAGLVCGFDLKVIGTGSRLISTSTDGATTRTVRTGNKLTFIDMDDPSSKVTFPSTTVTVVSTAVDENTTRTTTTGGSAILLFPEDVSQSPNQPSGPSAFLHLGQTVYLDREAFDTLESAEGPSFDICSLASD